MKTMNMKIGKQMLAVAMTVFMIFQSISYVWSNPGEVGPSPESQAPTVPAVENPLSADTPAVPSDSSSQFFVASDSVTPPSPSEIIASHLTQLIQSHVGANTGDSDNANFDLDNDNSISNADVTLMQNYSTLTDTEAKGVMAKILSAIRFRHGAANTDSRYLADLDANQNGAIDTGDYYQTRNVLVEGRSDLAAHLDILRAIVTGFIVEGTTDRGVSYDANRDLNNDGVVDRTDVTLLNPLWLQSDQVASDIINKITAGVQARLNLQASDADYIAAFDVDKNGTIDDQDLVKIEEALSEGRIMEPVAPQASTLEQLASVVQDAQSQPYNANLDMDKNGVIDIQDVNHVLDANIDSQADFQNTFVTLLTAVREAINQGAYLEGFDVDHNSQLDVADYSLIQEALLQNRNANSPLGTNLSELTYYSSQLAFVDVFKQAGAVNFEHPEYGIWINYYNYNYNDPTTTLAMGSNGYPVSLLPNQEAGTFIFNNINGHYPAGDYHVFFDGEGELRFGFDGQDVSSEYSNLEPGHRVMRVQNPTNIGIDLKIIATNPDNPLHNIRVIAPGFENVYQEQPFHPLFLAQLSQFKTIRFMDWMRTNASEIQSWDQRSTLADPSQTTSAGVALEYIIQLANTVNADMWINLPHMADDNYVLQTAELIEQNLEPGLKAYLEYSNEVWNSSYPFSVQSDYAQQQGNALGLGFFDDDGDPETPDVQNDFIAKERYYALRAVQIFRIFNEVFCGSTVCSSDRVVRVLGSQHPSVGVSYLALSFEYDWDGDGVVDGPAGNFADALAVAPYFGNIFGTNNEALSLGLDGLFSALADEIDPNNPNPESHYLVTTYQKEWADMYNLDLIAYEGGQHLVPIEYLLAPADYTALADLFVEANRDPRMADLYEQSLDYWAQAGGGMYVQYYATGTYSQSGSWGAVEYQDQILDFASDSKYGSIAEYIDCIVRGVNCSEQSIQ